jgi:hypothetical protein
MPMQAAMSALPDAGWFPDPEYPGHERWWDGTQWTDHRQAVAAAPEAEPTAHVQAVDAAPEASAYQPPAGSAPEEPMGMMAQHLALASFQQDEPDDDRYSYTMPDANAAPARPQMVPYQRPGAERQGMPAETTPWATAALFIGPLLWLIGVGIGVWAVVKISRSRGELQGYGAAITGIVLSFFLVPVAAIVFFPGLLGHSEGAQVLQAESVNRRITQAVETCVGAHHGVGVVACSVPSAAPSAADTASGATPGLQLSSDDAARVALGCTHPDGACIRLTGTTIAIGVVAGAPTKGIAFASAVNSAGKLLLQTCQATDPGLGTKYCPTGRWT